MLTEDYLMRMLRLAVAALARIAGLKKAGQYQDALDEIERTMEQLFGMRASTLISLDDESLLAALRREGEPDPEQITIVADLFREEGEILSAQKDAQRGAMSSLRALSLYLEAALAEGQEAPAGLEQKIQTVLQGLSRFELPPDTRYSLFCYDEQKGSYKEGEQQLLELMRVPGWKEDIPSELEAYYRRLLDLPAEDLSKGGMTQEQVKDNLARLISL